MYICKDGDCGYKGKEKQCCKECQHEKLAKIHVNTDMMEIVKQEIRF